MRAHGWKTTECHVLRARALRFRCFESVRNVAPVEEKLRVLFARKPSVGPGDRDCTEVLYTVDGSRLCLAIECVLRRLPREVELVPFHVGVVGTVIRMDAPAILPAANVVATGTMTYGGAVTSRSVATTRRSRHRFPARLRTPSGCRNELQLCAGRS